MSNYSFSLLILLLLCTISASAHPLEDHDEPITSFQGDTVYTPKVPTLEETNLDNLPSFGYYQKTCPQFESILHSKGCDASILLNHDGSERTSQASKTLRGFEVIDDIKEELEKHCPKTVSCADILAAATRDATVELGGPYWVVPYGRKDGLVSIAKEAEMVAMGHENITLRAHITGRASCGSIQYMLYNYQGTGKPDPSIDPKYLNFLQRKCGWASEYVDFDATTPRAFDYVCYRNLKKNMGLLSTDQLLYSDPRTSPIVSALAAAPYIFKHQFVASMASLAMLKFSRARMKGKLGPIVILSMLID